MNELGDINIFEKYLSDISIFKDRGVLRHTYTPEYLPHRDEQVNSLAAVLVAALRGDAPSNILIYGKTGTGKTAVAKYVGLELERSGEIRGVPCYVIYMNCEIVDTQYRLLAHLARHFDKDIPMTGWPTDQVYGEFKKAIDSERMIVIVMLDEIDKLIRKGDDVLYNLSRINGDLKKSRVSIIGISNDLKFTEFLDPRVKSSVEGGSDKFTTGEVYTIYRQMCHEIQMEVLTQRRITDLISELDMLGIVNAMVVSKGRYGRTKEISLSVPHESTQAVLLEDYRVKPLTNFTVPVATQTKLYI